MKGIKMPSISIPNVSLPNISLSSSSGINASSIKSAITSAVPDLSSAVNSVNLESVASNILSENLGEGVELPSEISKLIK